MKFRYNSPVILTFTLICVIVMFLNITTMGTVNGKYFIVYPTMNFTDPLDYFRLISHIIGHQTWSHLLGNFTFILLLGPILEEKYGSSTILKMILLTGFLTGVINVVFFSSGLMGASGIVFMFIILASFTNFKSGDIPITFILVILLFLTKEILSAVKEDNISQFAHILGGIFGSVFGFWKGKVH